MGGSDATFLSSNRNGTSSRASRGPSSDNLDVNSAPASIKKQYVINGSSAATDISHKRAKKLSQFCRSIFGRRSLVFSLWSFLLLLITHWDFLLWSKSSATIFMKSSSSTSSMIWYPSKRSTKRRARGACDGYKGILHIQSGDLVGAGGTIFFRYVIAQLIWADKYNFKPWVHFNNVSAFVYDHYFHGMGSVTFTMQDGVGVEHIKDSRDVRGKAIYPGPPKQLSNSTAREYHFPGDGVWQHYFEPVSDFDPTSGDTSCRTKAYVTLDLPLIVPGLHVYAPWAPRGWRYHKIPKYIRKPHLTLKEWLDPQRHVASKYVAKYIRFNAHMQELARQTHPKPELSIGLHIRWSDKADGRSLVQVDAFLPYVTTFVQQGGEEIFLATDSDKVLKAIELEWPHNIQTKIRRQSRTVLSKDETAVFKLGFSQHRTNTEVLTDILALSKCTFMLHGLSAVSESAMYLNPDLIDQSVNLEDPNHMTVLEFEALVTSVVKTGTTPPKPRPWWEQASSVPPLTQQKPTHDACEGYDGVLHIQGGESEASLGTTFFHYVLNQLIFADMNNLKPWIHLNNASHRVWDTEVHGGGQFVTFKMHNVQNPVANVSEHICPSMEAYMNSSSESVFSVDGTGVWEHYLEQVSNFVPGDKSCQGKPLIRFNEPLLSGIHSQCPWTVRAWRYDDLPDNLASASGAKLEKWYGPMRQRGHEIVQKYFRFRRYLVEKADEALNSTTPCLAVHVRLGDKAGYHRSLVRVENFTPYVKTFLRLGGQCVYAATDSISAMEYIAKKWPKHATRTQGPCLVRSSKNVPVALMDEENHHRVNSEALVDVLAMSKCDILVHGFSTMSEAAIYLNPKLHRQSINVEDLDAMSDDQYKALVQRVLSAPAL